MVKGITNSGFEYEINEKVVNDFSFLKAFRKANSSDTFEQIDGFSDLIALLLGNQEEAYYIYLRDKYDGIVPTDVLGAEIGGIIKNINDSSNSSKK